MEKLNKIVVSKSDAAVNYDEHALLSASSAYRWLKCTPSAVLCAMHKQPSSFYAQEGTDAHTLSAYKLRKHFENSSEEEPRDDLQYYSLDMEIYSDHYVNYVISQFEDMRERTGTARIMIENKVFYTDFAPQGFGTSDCAIIGRDEIHVIDLKYGRGVLVKSASNSQLMLYALGVLQSLDEETRQNIKGVQMTIYQPRRGNISTDFLSADELIAWGEKIKPIAEVAYRGEGKLKKGSWCKFCDGKKYCELHNPRKKNTLDDIAKFNARRIAAGDAELQNSLATSTPICDFEERYYGTILQRIEFVLRNNSREQLENLLRDLATRKQTRYVTQLAEIIGIELGITAR